MGRDRRRNGRREAAPGPGAIRGPKRRSGRSRLQGAWEGRRGRAGGKRAAPEDAGGSRAAPQTGRRSRDHRRGRGATPTAVPSPGSARRGRAARRSRSPPGGLAYARGVPAPLACAAAPSRSRGERRSRRAAPRGPIPAHSRSLRPSRRARSPHRARRRSSSSVPRPRWQPVRAQPEAATFQSRARSARARSRRSHRGRAATTSPGVPRAGSCACALRPGGGGSRRAGRVVPRAAARRAAVGEAVLAARWLWL
ncbi:LOW QUALITY PROTEIN: translation initiation factor IF-2-like [Lagopus leucura]|uniref:LOW QUALITY PROTEIN: translation initiation factor IF-2-like n=1 Tax=Lagopus leucura TaxID=30410 RepID=UPI001C67F906|nr:LOW QUALITY PROTEIN: translation initiation factor IF-2-like [Lagopus leucura]